jgi:hypothetical protein
MASNRLIRRIGVSLAGTVCLLLIAGLAAYAALPSVAERWAESWLARNGAADSDIEVGEIDMEHVLIESIALGNNPADATAQGIEIDFRIDGLAVPTIGEISIAEIHLEVDPTNTSRPLGILSDLIAEFDQGDGGDDTEGDGSRSEIPPISIEHAIVELPTLLGGVELHLSGTIVPVRLDRFMANLAIEATAPDGVLAGNLQLESDLAGNGTLRLEIDDGSAHFDGAKPVGIPRIAGAIDLVLSDASATGGTIELTAPEIAATGWPSASLQLHAEFDREHWSARIATDGPAAGLDGWLEAEALLASAAHTELDGHVTLAAGAPWWALIGLPTPSRGSITIDAIGDTAVGAASNFSLGSLPATNLSLTVSIDAMDWPGRLGALGALGAIDVTAHGSSVELVASSPLLIDAMPDPDWLARMGAGNFGIVNPGFLTAEIESGARATWSNAGDSMLDIAGVASLAATGSNPLEANLAGRLHFAPIGNLASFKATMLDLQIGGLMLQQEGWRASVGALSATGTADGVPHAWSADLVLAGQAAIAGNGFRIEGFEFELPALVRQSGSTTSLHAADSAYITLARPTFGDLPYRTERIRARLRPSVDPLLIRDCPEAENCTTTYQGQLLSDTISLHSETVTNAIEAGPVAVRFAGSVAADGTTTGSLGFDAGHVRFAEWGASAEALRIQANHSTGGKIAFEGSAENLTGADLGRWMLPLSAQFSGSLSGPAISFKAHLADDNEWVAVDATGTHRLDDNSGDASIVMQPIQFRPGGLQPWDIAPALSAEIDEATGQVTLDGAIAWSDVHVASDLVLRLEELSIVAPEADLARINGAIALQSLAPLISQPDQQVSVAQIDIGIPLTNALITFSIEEGPLFAIASARFDLAGGTVETAPVIIDPSDPDTRLELRVSDMNLGTFLELADVEGLAATGELTGIIPVEIRDNDIVIAAGRLDAEVPGALKYAPADPPAALQGAGETASLVLGALADFRYDQLWLTLDREAGGETVLGLHVRGSNPDFYDGYPIELNLSLTGELDRILRDSLVGYRIPDYVKDQLEEGQDGEDAGSDPDLTAGESP